ncbi:MAG: GNAT family N-acetyltransferase [Bacteroidales bacterium]|nr:GNAT family N-acetyltransferase [Candidatus Sodaliphilus fimicaballi]
MPYFAQNVTAMHNDIITLRALEPTDLDTLYEWENDASLWAVTDTVAPYSRKVLWQYLENSTTDIYTNRALRLMIVSTADGTPMGTIDFFNYDPLNNRAELGLFIAAEHRGKGVGRQALELLCDYARNHIGMRQLHICVGADNEPCLKLFSDYGFVQAGVLKDWIKRGREYRDAVILQYFL